MKRFFRGAMRRLARRIAPEELITALEFAEGASNPVFPKRKVTVVDRVPAGRVLVLAPHPDDEAIGMGGTLALHVANRSQVTVLYLTDGGGRDASERAELIRVRRAEAEAVGSDLGIRQVFWDHPDTELACDDATADAMAALLVELEPEVVYAPSIFDSHFDHFATNRVLSAGLERVPALDVPVLGYEVWDTIPFANHVVDVSGVVEVKDRILAHYVTPHRYTDFTALCRQRASVHFTLHVSSERERAAAGFAEAFLRFDAKTFRDLLARYVGSLRRAGSELANRP
jgi:LmbE family N-acetylglucosaminyl deacetylase